MNAGVGLFQTETDSIPVVGDYKMSAGENRVFYPETQLRDSADNHYSLNSNINRQLTPDWILYILIALLLVLSWLRLTYNKYIGHLFEAAFNYQSAQQVYTDPGIIQKRIFLLFNILYCISGGLYLYLLFSFFGWYPAALNGYTLLLAATGFLSSLMLVRVILLSLTAHIFNRQKLFREYLFHTFLYNKIAGIIVLPFILGIAYSKGLISEILIYASLSAVFAVFILRLLRLLIFIFKNVVLLFYLILYLCTLEILPLLVIARLILSLA